MRILIDLQGAQSGSRTRGIGRYSGALAKAIARNRQAHDIFILLNGRFPATIDAIKGEFGSIVPDDHFVVFCAPSPVAGLAESNAWRMQTAELIREAMINDLSPDVLLIMSMFEGASDDAVSSIGRFETPTKTAVILYDLIPLLTPDQYLQEPPMASWYDAKLQSLRSADLLLAISDSARNEAMTAGGFDADRVVAISSAADERFVDGHRSPAEDTALLNRLAIRRKFVMHTSAFEPRKNFDGLVRAFGLLPKRVREDHQLVLVADIAPGDQVILRRLAEQSGVGADELVLTGRITDKDLISLYSLCTLFVFPSFHEGFGLPALEAMRCGAAVIGSNTTSIPEVLGRADALFDPRSDASIAALMERALTDRAFWKALKTHAKEQSKRFSWDHSAILALRAMEALGAPDRCNRSDVNTETGLIKRIAEVTVTKSPSQQDWITTAECITMNKMAVRQYRQRDDSDGRTSQAEADAIWRRGNMQAIHAAMFDAGLCGTGPALSRKAMLKGRAPVRAFRTGRIIGIAPGSANPIQAQGRNRFAEVALRLSRSLNCGFVLIGAESARNDTRVISEYLPTGSYVDLAGLVAIADLPPVLAGFDLFIGNDTTLTHMAALMGVPTVCLSDGDAHLAATRPVGRHVITLRGKVACVDGSTDHRSRVFPVGAAALATTSPAPLSP